MTGHEFLVFLFWALMIEGGLGMLYALTLVLDRLIKWWRSQRQADEYRALEGAWRIHEIYTETRSALRDEVDRQRRSRQ